MLPKTPDFHLHPVLHSSNLPSLPSATLLTNSTVPELVPRHMKTAPLQQGSPKIKSSSHHPKPLQFLPPHTAKSSPPPLSLGVLYLQEWNKVVLFQVITARLGQEVHEFRSVVVTGLQSSGEEKREQMAARLLPCFARSILFYHSFQSLKSLPPQKEVKVQV